ncbi:MAG: hypothetical protein IJ202_05110 [Bacteroidales bacterium]|nr:hypothetical protein [Bacteroidales bacterium]
MMDDKVNEVVWQNGFRFFPTYAKAIFHELPDIKEQGMMCLAIVRYMFYDEEPDMSLYSVPDDARFIWDMIYPILKKSKMQANKGQGAPINNQNRTKNQSKNQ